MLEQSDSKSIRIKVKEQASTYKVPYPAAYDSISYRHRYKVPDFTMFFGQDDTFTVEHINLFIIQCGEATSQDAPRVRFFSMSLSRSAFAWFTLLLAKSILYWVDLEKQFHQFFYSEIYKKKLSDLTSLK